MTIKDIIINENYDCIDIRVTSPEGWKEDSILVGRCRSENGELIPLDGDIYSDSEAVLSSSVWKNEALGIKNGLTVLLQGEWL